MTASRLGRLWLFVAGFVALFVLSGIRNGSTYEMITAVFRLGRWTPWLQAPTRRPPGCGRCGCATR